MVVLDLQGVRLVLVLNHGIELTKQISKLAGSTLSMEVGAGGPIEQASLKVSMPHLRLWFHADERKVYLAFMKPPNLQPYFHVNIDRNGRDFMHMVMTDNGSLDNIVERILSGSGPGERARIMGGLQPILHTMLARLIARVTRIGEKSPMEFDLNDSIENNLKYYSGVARPVEVIEPEMAALLAEMKIAVEEREQQQRRAAEMASSAQSPRRPSMLEGAGSGVVGALGSATSLGVMVVTSVAQTALYAVSAPLGSLGVYMTSPWSPQAERSSQRDRGRSRTRWAARETPGSSGDLEHLGM
jgi:hypothetical protein